MAHGINIMQLTLDKEDSKNTNNITHDELHVQYYYSIVRLFDAILQFD